MPITEANSSLTQSAMLLSSPVLGVAYSLDLSKIEDLSGPVDGGGASASFCKEEKSINTSGFGCSVGVSGRGLGSVVHAASAGFSRSAVITLLWAIAPKEEDINPHPTLNNKGSNHFRSP